MWPGNTADVKTLIPLAERLKKRFHIKRICIVADRGMFHASAIQEFNDKGFFYILGTRLRKVKRIRHDILIRGGRFKEVYPERSSSKGPAPLKVKEVWQEGKRYIVCLNTKQARKDAAARDAIVEALKDKLAQGPKAMIGNKGYRKYLKISRDNVTIDTAKIKEEAMYDGKWVLETNTDLKPEAVALKYKELWQVEHVFQDMKSILNTRPIYHQRDDAIRGHVFCSFLALLLRKELLCRLEKSGYDFEWSDIIQDLEALQETIIEENGKRLAIRTECQGTCGKVFQSVRVAIPPTIRVVETTA
jgi:transposase